MRFRERTRPAPDRGFIRRAALAVGALAFPIMAHASVITADLGAGLRYVGLSDASVIAAHEGAQVVDLRFTDALEESAEGLAGRLRTAADSGATLIVLVNAATDPLLRRELALIQGKSGHIVFVGPATSELAPEITIPADIELERRACDALAAGVPPADLITEVLDKPRFDEAHLVRNRTNGNPDGRSDGTEPPASKPDAKPDVPKDSSLQRAVFLHRALIALGRIQPVA